MTKSFRHFMRSHPFDHTLREEEAAPALGSMPESPDNPDTSGGNTKNDLTARNTMLGISEKEADEDRASRVFDLHQPLKYKESGRPVFGHHGMLSYDTLPVTAEPTDSSGDMWDVTFHYTLANKEMITDVHGKQVDPEIIEDQEETLDADFLDWLEGHGYMGGSPDLGEKEKEPENPAPIGGAMTPAPTMPGAGPAPGGGTTMGQNMGVPTG